jgi:uncharacterized protein (UPF0276 family)
VSPHAGLSLIPDDVGGDVTAPLFEGGLVDAVEWTLDMGWAPYEAPAWIVPILEHYGKEGRLFGHGFGLSLMTGEAGPRGPRWLEELRREVERRQYRHVSEHFCFARAGAFAAAGPLPVPRTAATVALGVDRFGRLAEAAGLPVGLENLATSLSPRDAFEQGGFLEAIVAPQGGFLVLDVHNLYCQSASFGIPPGELLATYAADCVREIHVSGGSWDATSVDPERPIRRDTHNDDVPEAVFAILELALGRFPNVEAVFLERLPGTFRTRRDVDQFRADYKRMRTMARAVGASRG